MSQAAFALRAEYEGEDFAGTVALAGGNTYDVADALAKGKGTIVTDDLSVIDALSAYPALKSVAVPDKQRASTPAPKPAAPGESGAGNEPGDKGGDA